MTSRWQLAVAEDPAGVGLSEDRWLFHEADDGTAWAAVIDGASSDTDERPTGGDYADALHAGLLSALERTPTATPVKTLEQGIRHAAQILELPKPSEPSAAVGLVRWSAAKIDAAVLGDVSVVLLDGDSEQVLRDDRIARVGQDHRIRYKDSLRAGRGYGSAHDEVMRRLREAEVAARNMNGGYWIASALPSAAEHARTVDTDAGADGVILASDGAAAALTKYGLWSGWRELSESLERDPRAFADRIRQAERRDPFGRRWPRSKPHDDLAGLVLRHNAGLSASTRRST